MIRTEIPIWQKTLWTVEEAAVITNIGENRIRELIKSPEADFVFFCGSKKLIVPELFKDYIIRNIG